VSDEKKGIEQAEAALRRSREGREKVESLRPETKHIAGKAAQLKGLNTFSELMFTLVATQPPRGPRP
jgi:hypothetical protein